MSPARLQYSRESQLTRRFLQLGRGSGFWRKRVSLQLSLAGLSEWSWVGVSIPAIEPSYPRCDLRPLLKTHNKPAFLSGGRLCSPSRLCRVECYQSYAVKWRRPGKLYFGSIWPVCGESAGGLSWQLTRITVARNRSEGFDDSARHRPVLN